MPGNKPRNSAKDALGPDTFFRLYQGALQFKTHERRLTACFVLLLAGRLGLRLGELIHLREAHIDWARGEICIPDHDPCGCHYCWIKAYQKWGRKGLKELQEAGEWDQDVKWDNLRVKKKKEVVGKASYCTKENLSEILYREQFSPKSDRAARVISFGWSYRITACLMTFFDERECLQQNPQSINRTLKEAARNAENVDDENISVHPLRATGETFLANLSLDPKMLRDLAGWESMSTGDKYWSKSGRINTAKLHSVMGKKDEAPPVVPEEPETDYPIVSNPIPFKNEPFHPITQDGLAYDKEMRAERHMEQRDKPLRLRHPRTPNLPHDRTGFPSDMPYDRSKHKVPGHKEDGQRKEFRDIKRTEEPTVATTLTGFTDAHQESRSARFRADREDYRIDPSQSDLDQFDSDDEGPPMYAVLIYVFGILPILAVMLSATL